MIKHLKKRSWSLMFIFVLLLGLVAPSVSANTEEQVRYLALGDSLAAGYTANKEISTGYSDLTADYFKEQGVLETYSKAFAVPGYKTQNVLDDLTVKEDLREAVKQANLITISAGANDLLKDVKVDREKGTLTLDPRTVPANLQSIAENYTTILQTIKELNPNASVFVMGYYFPFPSLSDAQKPLLIELTHTLNKTIQAASSAQGAIFVPVYDKFGDNPAKFIPNPEDIHPNLEGYQLMSEALLESLANTRQLAADLPQGHWAEKELNILLINKLISVDEDGKIYPEKAMTRAETAAILFSSIPLTKSIPPNPGFKDVPETHPAHMAIAKLTEAGVFAKSEYFHPDASITRVQMAKVLSLAFHLKGDDTFPPYTDVTDSHWGAIYINAVTTNKVMEGYKNNQFGVNDATTRAQFAVEFVSATQTVMNK